MAKSAVKGVELVPGSPELSRAERTLSRETGAERLLALVLEDLPAKRWDFTLLDCPPGVSVLSVGALAAATEHVAPVDPSPLTMAGLGDTIELADEVRARLNSRLALSRVSSRTRAGRLTGEGLRERLGKRVYRTEIPERAVVVEAAVRRMPVVVYAPDMLPAEAFRWFAEEVEA